MDEQQPKHCEFCKRYLDERCSLYTNSIEEAIAICKKASWKEVDCQQSMNWRESLPTGLLVELAEAREKGVGVDW